MNEQTQNNQDAKIFGQKMGLFLASLPISDEAKGELFSAMTLLTPEELVVFVSQLEAKYADVKVQEAGLNLEKDLLAIKQKYDNKKQQLVDQTISDLSDLEKELDQLA